MKMKYELNIYSAMEFQKLERHLEKMAATGWMLKKMGQFFISYEEQEPKNVHFSVVFFPKTHVLTPEPSEDLLMLREFCERTGWKLAGEVGQMQVFYNESANPVPIETEAWIQVKNIHQTAKKTLLSSNGLFLGISILNIYTAVNKFLEDPLAWLAMGAYHGSFVFWFAVAVGVLVESLLYLVWYWRAKKKAEEEGVLVQAHSRIPLRILYWGVATLGMIYELTALIGFTSPKLGIIALILGVVMLGVIFGTSHILKFEKVSARTNMVITTIVSLMIFFLITIGLTSAMVKGDIVKPETEQEILLKLDEITDLEKEVRLNSTESSSIFLSRTEVLQYEAIEIKKRHTLNYWLYKIKTPFIYDLCKEKLLGGLGPRYRGSVKLEDYGYERVDMPIWKANEVYCCYEEGEPTELYALFYDDMMVQILVGWDFTEEEIIKIRDILIEE